jgi:hypothetical protein
MPLFSDFGNKQTRSEDVAAIDSRSTSVSPLDQFLGYAQSTVDSLSRPSPLSDFLSTANQQLGEMFPSVRALPGENILSQAGRLLPQTALGTGPSAPVRAGAKVVGGLLQGMGTAADQLKQGEYLGAGVSAALPALNLRSDLLGQATEEYLGPELANKPLVNLPIVGDVSTRNIAETIGAFGPETALERGVGRLVGGTLRAGARQIGQRSVGELAGAGVGGYLGYQNPPSNPLAPSEPGQEPTFGERLAGGVTGAVLGSQVPSVLRAARGLETAPLKLPGAGMLEIKPAPGQDSLAQMSQAMGKRIKDPVITGIDEAFKEWNTIDKLQDIPILGKIPLPTATTGSNFVDRYAPLKKLQDYAISQGIEPAEATAYMYARNLAGNAIAASESIKQGLVPAIANLNKQEMTYLNAYLAMKDVNNKVMMLGQRVRNKSMEEPLAKYLQTPNVQAILQQSPEAAPLLAEGKKKLAPLFYSLPEQVQQEVLRVSRGLRRATASAERKAQELIDRRPFGSLEVDGEVVPIKAQNSIELEESLDRMAGDSAQKVREAAQGVKQYVDSLRNQAQDAGLISPRLTEYFKTNFPDYVPIQIVDYLDNPSAFAGRSLNKLSPGDIVDKLTTEGSLMNRELPLVSVVSMAHRVELAAQKNRIAQNLVSWRETVPEIASLIRPLKNSSEASPRDVTFRVFEGGKSTLYAVDKKYQNIIQFEKDALPEWMRIASLLSGSKLLTSAAAQLSSEFLPKNAIRDFFAYAGRNISEGKTAKDVFNEIAKAYADTFSELGTAGKIGSSIIGGSLGSGAGQAAAALTASTSLTPEEQVQRSRRFMTIGGALGALGGYNLPGAVKTARAGAGEASLSELRRLGVAGDNYFANTKSAQVALQRALGDNSVAPFMHVITDAEGTAGKILAALNWGGDTLSGIFKPISAVGEAIERAPRLAQYRLETAQGASPAAAALAARDITIDFDKGSQLARAINSFVPFFNVGIQGAYQVITRDFANIKNNLVNSAKFITAIAIPALLAEAFNRHYFPNEYANVPNYLKESGIVLVVGKTPDTERGTPGSPQFMWLPLGEAARAPQALFTNLIDSIVKNNPEALRRIGIYAPDKGPVRDWGDVLKSASQLLVPSQFSSPEDITSPVGKTTIEILTNRDLFRNLDIVPDPLHALPPERQVRPWNSAISRALGTTFRVSPAKLEYAFLNLTGGTGKSVLGLTNVVGAAFGAPGPETPPGTTPASQFLNFGRDSVLGGIYREKGDQINQATRDATKAAQPRIVRSAITNLESDPEFRAMNPVQQAEEIRKLSLAVERLVLEAQDTSVFESTTATGAGLKYLTSNSYLDDTITDDAVQTYNAWKRNPAFVPMPSNEIILRAMMAVKSPLYQTQQRSSEQMRQRALNPIIGNIPNFAR